MIYPTSYASPFVSFIQKLLCYGSFIYAGFGISQNVIALFSKYGFPRRTKPQVLLSLEFVLFFLLQFDPFSVLYGLHVLGVVALSPGCLCTGRSRGREGDELCLPCSGTLPMPTARKQLPQLQQ